MPVILALVILLDLPEMQLLVELQLLSSNLMYEYSLNSILLVGNICVIVPWLVIPSCLHRLRRKLIIN